MFLPVALALALASPPPDKPTVTLTVWPKGQRVWQGHALYTGAFLRVDDPKRELACPELRVDWGDGSSSSVQSAYYNCDPYGLDAPIGYGFVPKVHPYREPGQYIVVGCVVDVRGECHKDLSATRLVSIRGTGEGRSRWAWR